MNSTKYTILFVVFAIILLNTLTNAQFWKMNTLSDRDLFVMETKASMASGICYKQEPSTFKDPTLKFMTLSYCCPGYVRNPSSISIKCDPICSIACINGICTAPDTCECYPGYMNVNGHCEELY